MAKYDGKTDLPVIVDPIIEIVNDAYAFLDSELCREKFRFPHVPPRYYKWVKIHSHRRGGYTTAALRLLNQYTSSLIVTHNYPAANRVRQIAIEDDLVPKIKDKFHDNILIQDHIIPHERMNDNWFHNIGHNEHYQLIIIDGASMIEVDRQGGGPMQELRHKLFNVCDLLVELS